MDILYTPNEISDAIYTCMRRRARNLRSQGRAAIISRYLDRHRKCRVWIREYSKQLLEDLRKGRFIDLSKLENRAIIKTIGGNYIAVRPPTKSLVREQIQTIIKQYPSTHMQYVSTAATSIATLKIPIPEDKPIILSAPNLNDPVNLGCGTIQIDINNLIPFVGNKIPHRMEVHFTSENPIYSKINGYQSSYYHPHVNANGKVCQGEAARALGNRFGEFDLVNALQIIEGLLRTYNPSSPYAQLDFWTDDLGICSECDNIIPLANMEDDFCEECWYNQDEE